RTDGTGAFSAFRGYLDALAERVALPEPLRREVDEAYDGGSRSWAAELEPPRSLLGRPGASPPLLDQMLTSVAGDAIERLTICAPYFDADAECLAALADRVAPAPVRVFVQSGRTTLTRPALERSGAQADVRDVRFRREDEGHSREAFIHAKFYAFESAG